MIASFLIKSHFESHKVPPKVTKLINKSFKNILGNPRNNNVIPKSSIVSFTKHYDQSYEDGISISFIV